MGYKEDAALKKARQSRIAELRKRQEEKDREAAEDRKAEEVKEAARKPQAAAKDARNARTAARRANTSGPTSPIYTNRSPTRSSRPSRSSAQQAAERPDRVFGSRITKNRGRVSQKNPLSKSKSAQQGPGEGLQTSSRESRKVDDAPLPKIPVRQDEPGASEDSEEAEEAEEAKKPAPSSSKRKAEEDADDRRAKRPEKASWYKTMLEEQEATARSLQSASKRQPNSDSKNLNKEFKGMRRSAPRATQAVAGPVLSQPTEEELLRNKMDDWNKRLSQPAEAKNNINKKDDGKKRKADEGLERGATKVPKLRAELKQQSSPSRSRSTRREVPRSSRSPRRDPLPNRSPLGAKQHVEAPGQADPQSRSSPLTPHVTPPKDEDDGSELDSLFEGSLSRYGSEPLDASPEASKQEATTPMTSVHTDVGASRIGDGSEGSQRPATDQALQKGKADTCTEPASTETRPLEEPEGSGVSKSSSEERVDAAEADKDEVPVGLWNYHRACFANAALQCLFGVPELGERYEPFASTTVSDLEVFIESLPNAERKERWEIVSEEIAEQLKLIREAAEIYKDDISMGAYFGALVEKIKASQGGTAVSPFGFLQAFGAKFPNETPWNGEVSQEARGFVTQLLNLLYDEEVGAQGNSKSMTLIQRLFAVKTCSELQCTACGYNQMTTLPPAPDMSYSVSVPDRARAVPLSMLLETLNRPQQMGTYRCDCCLQRHTTIKHPQPPELSKYLIVQAERIRPMFAQNGTRLTDENGATRTCKVETNIRVPGKMLDLSALFPRGEQAENTKYELFGMVNHTGSGNDDNGHYVALRKMGEQWWLCDDDHVRKLSDSPNDQSKFDEGTIFFFKRMD